MPLTPGTRLGPYEIQSPLGAGGMGEVYKARDTRLDRIVAIKVLPEALAADPQFRERFEREARAVAALNHPHICTLYDIGEVPNPQSQIPNPEPVRFLVMEYLEGETLADRLRFVASGLSRTGSSPAEAGRHVRRGLGLPIEEALSIATQIADALAAAHRAGITHRDLKPGNIFLTKTGATRQGPAHAKLLDFGLAKTSSRAGPFGPARAPGPQDPAYVPTALPTMPPELTAQGTILGTFQYMAPEQLEGKDADARTDIFAFGAVVYEMLAGKKAFEGKTQAGLIGAILEREPSPISSVQPLSPPGLDHVVKRCLAKDPDERWQTASDVMRELKWISEAGSQAPASIAPAPAARRSNRVAWIFAAVATVTTAAAIALGVPYLRSVSRDVHPMRFSVSPPQNVTLNRNTSQTVAVVSPDGRRVAFVANRAQGVSLLWVRSLDALDAQPLSGTELANLPFWSPDSRTLGFFAAGKLKTVDTAGGPVQSLCDAPIGRGGTWNRDGTIVFAPNAASGLFKVPAAGGQPTRLTTPDTSRRENSHRLPAFFPDGRHFLFFASPSNTVWLGSLDSNETTRLLNADSQAQYAAPGYLLFTRQGTLLAQPFDARRATLTGDAVPIAEQLVSDANNYGVFSVSDTGVLAYRTGLLSTRTQLTWFDRTGKTLGSVGQPGLYRNPVLSPDGTRAVVEATDSQTRKQDVWLVELARGVTSRFTFDPGNDIYPVWSPDGSRIMFGSDRDGGAFNLYQKLANGAGDDERVVKSSDDMAPYSWSPDGRSVVFRFNVQDLGIMPLIGDRKPRPFLQSVTFNQTQGQVSSDGRWIAYHSNESGRYEIYVRNFPTPGGKWQISQDGAAYARWRGDGKELFYFAADGRLMAVPIKGETAVEAGTAVPLFEARVLNGPNTATGFKAQYDVTRDGQRFLLNVPIEETASSPITVVINWSAALRK